ncbi:MAG: SAM-dependent chlorinase/fluorinase [Haloarculaceae archaeon]
MITLSSDFGSPYPAAMKGVIAGRTGARLVDVAHDLPRQDVRASAFWLREVLPYVPPAVHLAVVDPGVGTDRGAVVVRAGEHALVAPDNGLALPAARRLADARKVFRLDYEGGAGDWLDDPASSTFHGRDVFAPAAARVHEVGVDAVGSIAGVERTEEYVDLRLPEPEVTDEGAVGEALAVDGFGNVITNIPGEVLEGHFEEHVKANGVWASVRHTYAAVEEGHRVITIGSHGNVELAVNQGRGDETFGVYAGGQVSLQWS